MADDWDALIDIANGGLGRPAVTEDERAFVRTRAMLAEVVEMAAKPAPTLDETLADVLAWQRATFGHQDSASVFAKLRGEVDEVGYAAWAVGHLAGDPRAVLTECADVLIMLAGFVAARGFTLADLRDEVGAKDKINRVRTWRQNADGTWSHVKGGG